MELTQEEIKNILTLLARVDLKGSEAVPTAQIQLKLNNMLLVPGNNIESTPEVQEAPKE